MTRILADLPDDDIEWLDRLAQEQGTSRASLLREAVQKFLASRQDDRSWIDAGFGLWKDRDDIGDGVEYQQAMREERRPYEDI